MNNSIDETDSNWLLEAVRKVTISPEKADEIANKYAAQVRRRHPQMPEYEVADQVASKIVNRYAKLASTAGLASALPGAIPGLGTIASTTVGASGDAVACMKLQVDMTMCMAAAYGYDLSDEDARQMTFLIAATGTVNEFGKSTGRQVASKAAVKMVKRHLRKGALKAVKAAFQKIGITFTRKALVKAIPFGIGAAISGGLNYTLTRYVGSQARQWFYIDANPWWKRMFRLLPWLGGRRRKGLLS